MYTRINSGDKTVEWMISTDVEGASDAEHAVIRTYSWDTSPDLVATTLFEQEGDAIADLAERYNSEKASDQASGYAFDASIEGNARWAKITNYRASGDIDNTLWMRLPVTTTLECSTMTAHEKLLAIEAMYERSHGKDTWRLLCDDEKAAYFNRNIHRIERRGVS